MTWTARTKDGIELTGLSDEITPDSPELAEMIRMERAKLDSPEIPDPVETAETFPAEDNRSTFRKMDDAVVDALKSNPITANIFEAMVGVNRANAGLIDFIGPNPINALLEVAGADFRVPTMGAQVPKLGEYGSEYVGTAGELAGTAAQVGGVLRQSAQALPSLIRQGESAGRGVLRNMAATPGQDIASGALSGLGMEVGEEFGGESGKLVGAVLFPLAGMSVAAPLKQLLTSPQATTQLTQQLSQLSDDGARTLLADAMVREGLSPDDAVKMLSQLGDDALPADIGPTFARLLRTASNEVPRIEGRAGATFAQRQAGQASRLANSMDEAGGMVGLSLDDEIARMDAVLKPEITRLYNQARQQGLPLSQRLRTMLEGNNSLGRARIKAERRLADARAAGDEISNIDIVDATKKELGDQIRVALRGGKTEKARDLIRLKNIMVDEADVAIPVYREARNLYAGKAQIEDAAELGGQFFKLKARDLADLTSRMAESEIKMFKLGARRAILDKMDDLQMNADAVKRLFGKRGDIQRLRTLFTDEKAFNRFSETLERESQFIMTRNAAQANSTTTKQLIDSGNATDVIEGVRALSGDPTAGAGFFARILQGFKAKKGSDAYQQAIEKAGDILLQTDINPELLRRMLMGGDTVRLQNLLQNHLIKAPTTIAPVGNTMSSQAVAGVNREIRSEQ